MPYLHQPIIIKQPQWRDAVEAAIGAGSVRGIPTPPDLPPGGYLTLQHDFLRHRLTYRIKGGKVITLGSATEAGRAELRQRWLAKHPIALEGGRQVFVIFDNGNPDLPRPVPAEIFRRFVPAT